jgi:hypothetical protein
MPREQWQYGQTTGRRSDLEWTINQVRFDVAATDEQGVVRIQMGTVTPGFDTYLINIDRSGWQPSGRQVRWQMHAGNNQLQMRVRNTAGVEGPISLIELDYAS